MVEVKANKEMFVFFENFNGDFETLLGGLVDRFDERGRAYVPSYQMWVKPVAIFPAQAGEKIYKKIEKLEKEFSSRKKELNIEYKEKINSLIG